MSRGAGPGTGALVIVAGAGRERTVLEIGLAVGEGTGPEVRDAFEAALGAWAEAWDIGVRLRECEHRFRTFGGITAAGLSPADTARVCEEDAARYADFLRELAARGTGVVFRTAINAQPLYAVRERFGAVKVDVIPTSGGELVLVRDQAQGFYAGENDSPVDADRLVRTCRFSRETTERVLDLAYDEAVRHFGGPERIERFVLAYKFHLLDRRLAIWVSDWGRRRGVDPSLFQPDTTNRQLHRGLLEGNVLLVGANEWGDIMHAELIHRAGLGSQDEHCSRNRYTALELGGLVEYQTVHGSADDIGGLGVVNPTAALRAAAAILEEHAGATGVAAALEAGLSRVRARGVATADVGGGASTDEVVHAVIGETLVARSGAAPAAPARRDEALVVIDLQNDFCAGDGHFARLGLVDPASLRPVAAAVDDLARAARAGGVPVFFVRTHADPERLPANVVERHRRQGRLGSLRSGEWGAGFFEVAPAPTDTVVTKALYDPFLGTDLQARLEGMGVRRLVLAGVFADVCVEATARTAFQLGFEICVVGDGTIALERDTEQALAFMERYYDARVAPAKTIADRWQSAPEDTGRRGVASAPSPTA